MNDRVRYEPSTIVTQTNLNFYFIRLKLKQADQVAIRFNSD